MAGLARRAITARALSSTLGGGHYSSITLTFHPCYVPWEGAGGATLGSILPPRRTLVSVVDRKDLGSWLGGAAPQTTADGWPGKRLGLPREGAGALAPLGRRLAALVIDWALCSLIAAVFLGYRWGSRSGSFDPLLVFVIENVLLVSTLGTTIGHRLLGLQVQRLAGSVPGPVAGVIRSLLLAVVIPAVIWDSDGRGLHDKAAGTVILRAR